MYTLIHICISSSLPHKRKHTIHSILDLIWNCGWKPIHGLRIPGLDEWIKKMWYVYTMEYYLAIKRNGTASYVVIWMNLEYVTSCKELTHWKRLWCWEWLGAGGEGDDRGWDGWMASPTRWTWVWVNSRSWWWTGGPGVLQFMGLQRVGHDWATELIILFNQVF